MFEKLKRIVLTPGGGGDRCRDCGMQGQFGYSGNSAGSGDYFAEGCLFCAGRVCDRGGCALSVWSTTDIETRVCRKCADRYGIFPAAERFDREGEISPTNSKHDFPEAAKSLGRIIKSGFGPYCCTGCGKQLPARQIFRTLSFCRECRGFACRECFTAGPHRHEICTACAAEDVRRKAEDEAGKLGCEFCKELFAPHLQKPNVAAGNYLGQCSLCLVHTCQRCASFPTEEGKVIRACPACRPNPPSSTKVNVGKPPRAVVTPWVRPKPGPPLEPLPEPAAGGKKSPEFWINLLTTADGHERLAAARRLESLGEASLRVLPRLLELATDESHRFRRQTALLLVTKVAPVTPEIEALCWAAWKSPHDLDRETLEALEAYLNRPKAPAAAAQPTAAALTARADSPSSPAAAAPLEPARASETLPIIAELIRQLDAGFFQLELNRVIEWGAKLRPATRSISRYLFDDNEYTRRDARRMLMVAGLVTAEIVPDLLRAIRERKGHVDAMELAAIIGPAALSTVPEMIPFLAQGIACERDAAAKAILAIGAPPAECLASITKALGKKLSAESALRVLANMGPAAAPAAPDVARCLQADYPPIRLAACEALEAMGPAAAVASELLERLAQDQNERLRSAATRALRASRKNS